LTLVVAEPIGLRKGDEVYERILLALIIFLIASAHHCHRPSDGSYFQIGDIRNVAGKEGLDLQVMTTKVP
jgi:hypothetical protein